MIINTFKFGEITIDDAKILQFDEGILGFEHLSRFALVTIENLKPFHFLQAVDDGNMALPVINVLEIIERYTPLISTAVFERLGLETDDDLIVLAACVIPREVEKMTANLSAPILINTKTNHGLQTILDKDEYPMRYSIYESLNKKDGVE